MKQTALIAALLILASAGLPARAAAHGGTYRGTNCGGVPEAPSAPAGSPGAPASDLEPRLPGSTRPTGAVIGGRMASGANRPDLSPASMPGIDLTAWDYWWTYNKEPYLILKSHIQAGTVLTGSDDFFLGQGAFEKATESMGPNQALVRGTIVPALRHALESEHSNDILDSCLIALAKIGDAPTESEEPRVVELIKPFLASPSQQLAETAAVALGILGDDSQANVSILLHLLRDESPVLRGYYDIQITGAVPARSRAFAAYGLGLIGSSARPAVRARIVETLVQILEVESPTMGTRDIPVACVIALALTPLPLDPERDQPAPSDDWTRPEQLSNLTDQVQFLMSFYEDTDTHNFLVRAHVPSAVARLLAPTPHDHWLRAQVATRLLQDLEQRAPVERELQQSCVQALGVIGDCDADPIDAAIRSTLMSVASGRLADQQTRNFARIALGHVAGRPGRGAGDPIAGLRAKRAHNPQLFLIHDLQHARRDTRPWAALGLAVMERSLADARSAGCSESARAAIRAALEKARSPLELGGYAVAVGIVRDPLASDILRKQLEEASDDAARGYCAVGLGLINDRGATEQVTEIVSNSRFRPELLNSAATGLGLLGDKRVVEQLVEMLAQATSLSSQAAIASALGVIGDSRSVKPLVELLEDREKTDLARAFAAVALGIIADREPLPWNTKISVNINYRASTPTLTSPSTGMGILDLL